MLSSFVRTKWVSALTRHSLMKTSVVALDLRIVHSFEEILSWRRRGVWPVVVPMSMRTS